MSKRILAGSAIVVLIIAALIPLSIGKAQSGPFPNLTSSARFRVVIAAPLSTAVDVYLDGAITTVSGLAAAKPLDASGYVTTVGGAHTVTLDQTGTITAVGPAFSTTLTAGTNNSLVLLPNMTWMVIPDLNTPPAAMSANVRLVNLSPNNNLVSLSVNGAVPAAFTNIAYQATSASYVSYTAGLSYTLAIPGSLAKAILYTFQDGHVYSVFIFFDPAKNLPKIVAKSDTNYLAGTVTPTVIGGTPVPTATVGTPVPTVGVSPTPSPSLTNANFRIVNADPAGPAVDVLVDGVLSKMVNVTYATVASYRPVTGSAAPGTSHTIAVVATGTTAPVLASVTANFVSLSNWTIVFVQGSTSLLKFSDNDVLPTTGFTSVRFMNLSPDAGSLSLEVDGSVVSAFNAVSSDKESGYTNVSLVPHILWVVPSGSTTPALVQNENFQARRVYTVLVFGLMNASPSTLSMLVKVDYSDPIKIDLPLIER